jgi:hypothetical protein
MDHTETARKLAFFETLNTVCWVTLDISWFFEAKLLAAVFAVPTILTCLAILRYTEKTAASLLVSGAVTFWASFNVFWVLGDLEMLLWGLEAAKVFIALLVICLAGALVDAALNTKARATVLARLRRLRIGVPK